MIDGEYQDTWSTINNNQCKACIIPNCLICVNTSDCLLCNKDSTEKFLALDRKTCKTSCLSG